MFHLDWSRSVLSYHIGDCQLTPSRKLQPGFKIIERNTIGEYANRTQAMHVSEQLGQ